MVCKSLGLWCAAYSSGRIALCKPHMWVVFKGGPNQRLPRAALHAEAWCCCCRSLMVCEPLGLWCAAYSSGRIALRTLRALGLTSDSEWELPVDRDLLPLVCFMQVRQALGHKLPRSVEAELFCFMPGSLQWPEVSQTAASSAAASLLCVSNMTLSCRLLPPVSACLGSCLHRGDMH